jgi:hypothetical protein
MNSELENRVFDIRPDILEFIRQQPVNPNIDRNKNLLETGKVTYGQLERILHDMKYMDKKNNIAVYNLYGGKLMEEWGKMILKNERDLINNRKAGKKNTDSLSDQRKGAYKSSHTQKSTGFLPPTNLIKANSEKSSTSSFAPPTLFEQINRMKKLITWQK